MSGRAAKQAAALGRDLAEHVADDSAVEGALDELVSIGRVGRARRLLDRRFKPDQLRLSSATRAGPA